MLEKDFLDSIDCKFPYNEKGKEIIKTAVSISDNSVFWVIHELVRPPKSMRSKIKKIDLKELLNYVNANFQHPLKIDILSISEKIINSEIVSASQILNIMDQLRNYRGLYTALNILYFACDDSDWRIEEKYNEIVAYWR